VFCDGFFSIVLIDIYVTLERTEIVAVFTMTHIPYVVLHANSGNELFSINITNILFEVIIIKL